MAPPKVPCEQRFVEKYEVDLATGCWLWTASRLPNGYAQFHYTLDERRGSYGHRFAYEFYVEPIPSGMQIHHTCKTKECVNPEHLELLSPREHVLDRSDGVAAKNIHKTHCRYGHEYTEDNTYVNARTGRRTCRTCQHEWREAHHEERRTYAREYWRKRYGNDPAFADSHRKRSRDSARKRRAEPL